MKEKVINAIDKRISDLNYMINSTDKDDPLRLAREYAREHLQGLIKQLNYIFEEEEKKNK